MNIARFKKIPEWLQKIMEEFEASTLDFWFWGLITRKSNNIINFCAKKYADEIKEDVFAFAKEIKIEIAIFQNNINDLKLEKELKKIKKAIKTELDDIQIFFKTKRKGIAYEN